MCCRGMVGEGEWKKRIAVGHPEFRRKIYAVVADNVVSKRKLQENLSPRHVFWVAKHPALSGNVLISSTNVLHPRRPCLGCPIF